MHTYNIIDLTEDQWIEDKDGNRCIEKQMTVNSDMIIYYYENCPIRRVVKPKERPTPRPK